MQALSRINEKIFYGWVVLTAYLVISTIVFGTRHSFGVFFKSLESAFDLNRAETSGIFSVYMAIGSIVAFSGGWALDRFGPRVITFLMGLFAGLSLLLTSQVDSFWQLFITYSLLFALGTGALYSTMMATVARWFNKRRGLAVGIAGAGVGLGPLVMAPFANYFIVNFDWRMGYIVMGLIAGIVIISLAALLKKDPGQIGAYPDGITPMPTESLGQDKKDNAHPAGFSLAAAFRTRSFWFVGIAWLSMSLCFYLVVTHIVPHATDVGISASSAALVLSLSAGSGIPGRLIMGSLSDRMSRKALVIICALLQAAAMAWLIWSRDLWMFYLFAVVFGFGFGGADATITALIGDTFGVYSIGAIMGVLSIAWGIGATIGPVVGGLIFDVTKSYFIAFLIGVLATLVTILSVALTRRETGINKELRKGRHI